MTESRDSAGLPAEPDPTNAVVEETVVTPGATTPPGHHRGDFAEGGAHEHVSTENLMGDFAEGQETRRRRLEPELEHRGDFAEGQADTHTAPGALRGDFAEGQEKRPRR